MRIIDKLRERLRLMLSIDCSPHKMALASALGMIVGINPYIGLQTYMALAVSSIFKLPLYPLIIGAYVSNPITTPFIFIASVKIGVWVLGMDIDFDISLSDFNLRYLLEIGKTLLLPLIVGCHILALILSIFTYPIVYYIMKRYRQNKARGIDG